MAGRLRIRTSFFVDVGPVKATKTEDETSGECEVDFREIGDGDVG